MTVSWKAALVLAVSAALLAGGVWTFFPGLPPPRPTPALPPPSTVVGPPAVEATTASVRELCVKCHAFPPPDSFPREIWRQEIRQAYRFIREARIPGPFPDEESVARFYESRAPEAFPVSEPSV